MKSATEIWFDKLQNLWIQKRINEIENLVANQFVYHENPFGKPITNVSDLIEVWREVKDQNIKILEIDYLGCTDRVGFAKYHFVAEIDGKKHESKGSYFIKLNSDGEAVEFRQWWNNKE